MKYIIDLTDEERKLMEAFMISTTNELDLFKTAKFEKFEEPKNPVEENFEVGDVVSITIMNNVKKYIVVKVQLVSLLVVGKGEIFEIKKNFPGLKKTGINKSKELDNLFDESKENSCPPS